MMTRTNLNTSVAPTGKIIGIGLSKTGTSSLVAALNVLGFDAVHFPDDPQTLAELRAGQYALTVLKHHQAIAEGIAPYFAQLDHHFPNSKFILTVREMESWLQSAERHWPFVEEWARCNRDFDEAWEFYSACIFGSRHFSRERFVYVYNNHVDSVKRYFAHRPHDLLVMNICAGEGWELLCPFLAAPDPMLPFPVANQDKNKDARREWISKFHAFRRQVQLLNVDAQPFVLVDDNRMHGTDMHRDSAAQPFSMRNGQYWGPPSSCDDAWRELESQRMQGASKIIFSWDAFWWFDHYTDFTDRVRASYACVADNDLMRIFDLVEKR